MIVIIQPALMLAGTNRGNKNRRPKPDSNGPLDDPLWLKLSQFPIDKPGATYPLSARLARENCWSSDYAVQVLNEYRKFLYLRFCRGEHIVASPDIETCWRLHLIYTENYWHNLCGTVFDRPLHHACEHGRENAASIKRRFSRTTAAYRNCFGEPPPAIWHLPSARYRDQWEMWREHSFWTNIISEASEKIAGRQSDEIIPAKHQLLWRRLKCFDFDGGDAYPFSRRLAEENGWNPAFTALTIAEYRKFLFLLTTSGRWVTPALAVDKAWHLHLGETRMYWTRFCSRLVGRPIHHHPGDGNDEMELRFKAIYERTLVLYASHFGEPPFLVWGNSNTDINWRKILADGRY